jgi:hypothetical protein
MQHWIMGMEAVVQREMYPGHVKISPKETAAVIESACQLADSSVVPPSILANDQQSRIVTVLPHHKGVYTLLV